MKTRIRLLASALVVVLAASVLSGCGGLQRPNVEKRYFNIETPYAGPGGAPLCDAVLVVRRLNVSPLFTGKSLIYRTTDGAYESDFYNAFFASPADMLTQDLRLWMRGAGLFSHMVTPSSLVMGRYALEGNIISIYGDFASGEAVLQMQFFLVDERSPVYAIMFEGDYAQRVPMAEKSPAGMVRALTTATTAIFTALEADLRAVAPGLPVDQTGADGADGTGQGDAQ